jgi:uncharacterized protein YbaR (Trm112 family)
VQEQAVALAGAALLEFAVEGNRMAVSKELLDILVCPLDKTPVKLTADKQGLKCPSCRRVYPIREDIPVMLVDEARVEAE